MTSICLPINQNGLFCAAVIMCLACSISPVRSENLLLHWRFGALTEGNIELDLSGRDHSAQFLREDFNRPLTERMRDGAHGVASGSARLKAGSAIRSIRPLPLPERWTLSFWIKNERPVDKIPSILAPADLLTVCSQLIGLGDEWLFRPDPDDIGLTGGWHEGGDPEQWTPIEVPAFWSETHVGGKYHGYGWYMNSFYVPEAFAGFDHELYFGGVDEQGWVYVNGELVGEQSVESTGLGVGELWNKPFSVRIKAAHLRGGEKNLLVVRTHASSGQAGIFRAVRFVVPEAYRHEADLSGLSGPRDTPGDWEHVAMVVSPETALLFINGRRVAAETEPSWARDLRHAQLEFRQRGRGAFAGCVDDVRVFGAALSDDDIAGLFQSHFQSGAKWPQDYDPAMRNLIEAGALSRERTEHMRGLGAPEPDALINTLKTDDRLGAQLDAIWALGIIGDAKASAELMSLLTSDNELLPDAAATAIWRLHERGAFPEHLVSEADEPTSEALNQVLQSRAVVELTSDFPGGNVQVIDNRPGRIKITPDLRDGRPWFYWYFEAHAVEPGRMTFAFTDSLDDIAFHIHISARGPAISHDKGRSWQWMGTEGVDFADDRHSLDAFSYDFKSNETVRFAVTIPYLQKDLDAFLAGHSRNPHLRQNRLTETIQGRPVELLQVGEPDPGRKAVLIAARSHACETMASFVLEGFLAESMSDSPFARKFREHYVLYAVPFVDKDGMQAGDQGKNRFPHDHNRDYGENGIYPETAAIQRLAEEKSIRLALDLHCPLIRTEAHEVFYFAGVAIPHIHDNVSELALWLAEESPPTIQPSAQTMVWMRGKPQSPPPTRGISFSRYFAYRPDMMIGATLEVPYTQSRNNLDADQTRAYGAGLLRAWVRTAFINADDVRDSGSHAEYAAFQRRVRTLMRQPEKAEALLSDLLDDPKTSPLYRIEAHNLMGMMRSQQQRFQEALEWYALAASDPNATTRQRVEALKQRVLIQSQNPEASADELAAALAAFEELPYVTSTDKADVQEAMRTARH